jgi:restriction endonuclease Mrr
MEKAVEETKNIYVKREVLAGMLLLTSRQVDNLWKAGHIPKESRGQYDLLKVIPAMIRYKNAQIEAEKNGNMTHADAEKMTAIFEMKLKEIKLAEAQKTVMNIADIESALTPPIISTRKKLDVLIKEIQKTMPKDEPPEIRKSREKELQKIVDEASNELADIPKKLFGEKSKKGKKEK